MRTERTFEMSADEYWELREESAGFCLDCGTEASECEPDAREYTCEECGAAQVFGIEELMMDGKIIITDGKED